MIKGRKTNYPEVRITQDMMEKALAKAEEMGKLKNSITEGERNLVGFLGEEIANSYIQGEIQNTYEYDILWGKIKIDVKSKDTTVYPKSNYEVSVANFNTKQKCDYYVFVRVLDDLSVGWLLGYMSKQDYFENSRFLKKGEKDGSNSFIVRADCHNMFINDLKKMEDFHNEISRI